MAVSTAKPAMRYAVTIARCRLLLSSRLLVSMPPSAGNAAAAASPERASAAPAADGGCTIDVLIEQTSSAFPPSCGSGGGLGLDARLPAARIESEESERRIKKIDDGHDRD